MSGGIAYVLDLDHTLYLNVNQELVDIESVESKQDIETLQTILEEHAAATDSELAKDILANYPDYLKHFKKIVPRDYQHVRDQIKYLEDKGYCHDEATLKAFRMIHPK